jgi:hypothetical protein
VRFDVYRIITIMNFTCKVTVSYHWIDKIDVSHGCQKA